jgi:hypothetical protein
MSEVQRNDDQVMNAMWFNLDSTCQTLGRRVSSRQAVAYWYLGLEVQADPVNLKKNREPNILHPLVQHSSSPLADVISGESVLRAHRQ